jgi:hypothetical protein
MAVNPDVTLVGKLATIFTTATATPTSEPEFGSIELALCGYGSEVPKVGGEAIFGNITQSMTVQPAGDPQAAHFEIIFYSNGLITPPGTYYTVTTRNANRDIVQVEAYYFEPGQWDLSNMQPYDPGQPPPPLPPLIIPRLLNLGIAGYDIVFPGETYTSFLTTLAGDVGNASIENMVAGNLYTFIILQDATGGHLFGWPPNVYNATLVSPSPNTYTTQTFVALDNGSLYAIGPGTYYTL